VSKSTFRKPAACGLFCFQQNLWLPILQTLACRVKPLLKQQPTGKVIPNTTFIVDRIKDNDNGTETAQAD